MASCDAGARAPGLDSGTDADLTPPEAGGGRNDAEPGPVGDGGWDGGSPSGPSKPLVDCHPERPALALYPGAKSAADAGLEPPYPCAASTGQKAPFNTSLAVTNSGGVFFAPVAGAGVLGSRDNGATWNGPLNDMPQNANWGHPWIWRDPDTNRMFFTAYNSLAGPCGISGTGHNLWISDDDGKTWEAIKGGVGCGAYDFGKSVTGPAATAASKQALAKNGYPNIVYFCAGFPTYILGPNHACFRSLDGGHTFTRTKADAIDPARGQYGYPNAGAVAPDGTFYLSHPSNQGVALSTSEDEGDSWHDIYVPNSVFAKTTDYNFISSNVATDAAGNLYVTWVDDRDLLPYLAMSKDRGKTWTRPLMIGAPGVQASMCVSVAVKRSGYVAVAYYGSPDATSPSGGNGHAINDKRPYDAYLTVTTDVFASEPLFWSAKINDPAKPALDGIDLLTSEYIGAPAFGPDGSIWAAYLHDDHIGLAGRLTAPP